MSYAYASRKRANSTAPKSKTVAPQPSLDALRSGAAKPTQEQMGHRIDLPDAMRTKMENAFGADLSAVKLYESQAVADAGANAVAQGANIAFAPGMLDFTSYGGQALLGHEISHVVSRARGEVTGGGFLNDPALDALLKETGMRAIFCVHRNVSRFETCFTSASERIEVKKWDEVSVPALLKKAAALVPDFSSVYMDFAFMKKPVVYYQFDRETYRRGHLPTGYFDYERDGFGPIAETGQDAIAALAGVIENGCRMAAKYEERVDRFYTLRDKNSAERTTEAIREMIKQQ